MKILYLLLLTFILYSGFYYLRFRYILSHAHLPKITQSDHVAGGGPKLRYIAAGDSTAMGIGASSDNKSYPYKVADYLALNHQTEYKNIAVSGAKTSDLITTQLPQIIAYNPDIVTISIGANDITHFVNTSGVVQNYESILRTLTSKTHARIYITNVPRLDKAYLLPYPVRWYWNHKAETVNSKLRKLKSDRITFVDIHSTDVSNSADQFHPNDTGYTFWTEAFIEQIEKDY